MRIIRLKNAIDDQHRSKLLFAGHIIVYEQRSSMQQLIEFTKVLLEESLSSKQLGEVDPTKIQNFVDRPTFLSLIGEVQTQFRKSPEARQLFFQVLKECGVDTKKTSYDHFPLRVVPFADQYDGAHRAAIGHHRDTWGSNIDSQQNWWAPIFNVTEQRTIAIYPDYWQKPLANTTATWSFRDFLLQRKNTENERSVNYPSAPIPTEKVDESNVLKLIIQPGDVLNFSSAHLHASIPNISTSARYSVEMRTINQGDLTAGLKAPNIDNKGSEPMYSWFKQIS